MNNNEWVLLTNSDEGVYGALRLSNIKFFEIRKDTSGNGYSIMAEYEAHPEYEPFMKKAVSSHETYKEAYEALSRLLGQS